MAIKQSIGRLLLKKFQRRKARGGFFFWRKKQKAAPTKSRTKLRQTAIVRVVKNVNQNVRANEPNNSKILKTSDLIRPNDPLKQSIEAFLLDQRSAHTRLAYGKDLKRFVKFLNYRGFERGVESLDRALVVAYKDSLLAEGLQHTSIDRHLATLRSFFLLVGGRRYNS